jgi:hypothetical protein
MSEPVTGIIVLLSLSVVAAMVSHLLMRSYLLAALSGALAASILFQVANYVHLGHLDPFAMVAFVFGGGIAFVIGLVVGVPFRLLRSRRER